jgi:hypothetical protein
LLAEKVGSVHGHTYITGIAPRLAAAVEDLCNYFAEIKPPIRSE